MSCLGVIIIHYGRSAPTIRCVESVLGQDADGSVPVVVVDNFGNLRHSDFPQDVKILLRRDNPGFGGGANAGVAELEKHHACRAYLILNNDAVLAPGFIDAANHAFEKPRTGAVGGLIRESGPEGRIWYTGGDIRLLTGTVRQNRSAADTTRPREVGFIPGTAIVIWREAWEDVGGFDESYFLYNEDIDLCLRLKRAGWRLRFCPKMICIHDLGESTGSGVRSALYLEQLTRTRLKPFRPRIYRMYLCLLHSIYNLTRMASIFLHRGMAGRTQIRAIMRGHLAALREVVWNPEQEGKTRTERCSDDTQ